MAQLINITSEALQATIRRLLPSQQGFGEDLQASNVITPIIDLTPTAEGSEVRQDLQTAQAYDSQTSFSASGGAATIANSPGFYRITGIMSARYFATAHSARFQISNGLVAKDLYVYNFPAAANNAENLVVSPFDFVVFLSPTISVSVSSSNANSTVAGSSRQIADVNGNLVDPAGFTPQ